jgi:hypothetical protein
MSHLSMVNVGVSVEVFQPREFGFAEETSHRLQRHLLDGVNPGDSVIKNFTTVIYESS